MSSQYVSSHSLVPLPGLVPTNTSSIQTESGKKPIVSGPTHVSPCEKMSACMARMLAGFGGAALIMMGAALTGGENSLLGGLYRPLICSAVVGVSTGLLSETKQDAALNAVLLGTLVQSVALLSEIR